MIALDTNILLRFLAEDDPDQARATAAFIENELSADRPGYVSVIVTCELVWTLKRFYRQPEERIRAALARLLDSDRLVFAEAAALRAGLTDEVGLPDRLLHELGRAAGCAETVTFDRRFARLPGVRLLGE